MAWRLSGWLLAGILATLVLRRLLSIYGLELLNSLSKAPLSSSYCFRFEKGSRSLGHESSHVCFLIKMSCRLLSIIRPGISLLLSLLVLEDVETNAFWYSRSFARFGFLFALLVIKGDAKVLSLHPLKLRSWKNYCFIWFRSFIANDQSLAIFLKAIYVLIR